MHVQVFIDNIDETSWPKRINHSNVENILNAVYSLTQVGWPLHLAVKFAITPVGWVELSREQALKALESIRDTGDFEWEAVK